MKDSIYTIPISEVFEPKCGCPMCSLAKTLEERWVEYITGAAMMEPDVRIETNRHGFCSRHFDMMLSRRNRLSVALILQSRLEWIDENMDKPSRDSGLFHKQQTEQSEEECFVCFKLEGEAARIAANIASVWARDSDFRELYNQQEYLCYPHTSLLLKAAESLRGEKKTAFIAATSDLSRKKLRVVKADIDAFCNLFDYRNAGSAQPEKEVAGAVESAIAYLTHPSAD